MAVSAPTSDAFERELESHRRGLTGYCYRLLGSGSEAEDAVQEAMTRAWRKSGDLQDLGALKAWLYRIASNVCFDMLDGPQRRALPMDLNAPFTAGGSVGAPLHESVWVQPIADAKVVDADDPAEIADARETLRLAFVAALQHLPPKQRAVLVLREVLHWSAAEVGELLDLSVASVNSALQRARATLEKLDLDAGAPIETAEADLLAKYVTAFEAYDITALVGLLKQDAQFTMPPLEFWVTGPDDVHWFMLGPGEKCRNSKLLVTAANGAPAVAIYNPSESGELLPWAIVVMEFAGGAITGLHHYLEPELFERFGLPARLEA